MTAAISNDESVTSVVLHERPGFRQAGVYRRVGWKFGRWLDGTLMQIDTAPTAGVPAGRGLILG